MLGSLVKETLPDVVKKDRKDIVFVSIMPCTAKKFEAKREEFSVADSPDVDYVITTHELALLIRERGILFNEMEPEAFDMPYGFNTGGGVIFGNSGGVSEAAIRFAGEKLSGRKSDDYIIREVRGEEGIREVGIQLLGYEAQDGRCIRPWQRTQGDERHQGRLQGLTISWKSWPAPPAASTAAASP